jgi:pimeloyl-ACP methyl ester carboxylesterase
MSSTQSPTVPTLNFLSLSISNGISGTSILLLHSGYSSHREFSLVIPHLTSYHLLIPDLPSHGQSTSSTIPFSPFDTAALLADLVAKESPSGKAHVVGVSLGGLIALYLAAKYPHLVESVFVSGCGRNPDHSALEKYRMAFIMAIFFPTVTIAIAWLPPSLFRWLYNYLGLAVPEGLQGDQRAATGYRLGGTLAWSVLHNEFSVRLLEKVRARTLVVAAELDDDVEGTRAMALRLRQGNIGSRAVKLAGKRHIWSLQDGELFARSVEAWLMKGEVLGEFQLL